MRSPKSSLADGSGERRGDAARVTRRNNSGEVPAGHPRGVRCGAGVLAAAMLGLGIAGCGGGDAPGATVSVYVAASLCAAAKAELASHGATAGNFKVAASAWRRAKRLGEGSTSRPTARTPASDRGHERRRHPRSRRPRQRSSAARSSNPPASPWSRSSSGSKAMKQRHRSRRIRGAPACEARSAKPWNPADVGWEPRGPSTADRGPAAPRRSPGT